MHVSSPSDNGGRGAALPALGPRGEGWVVGQTVLLLAIALSALVGLEWPDSLKIAAYVVGALLMVLGTALVVAGGVQLGSSFTPFPLPRAGASLSAAGIYARARHPMYGGAILLAAGWCVVFATVVGAVLTVLLAVFFELKARREEEWLVGAYPAYADYRR